MNRLAIAMRIAAILLVILAIVDPAVTITSKNRPIVSLVSADYSRDSLLLAGLDDLLQDKFELIRGPFPAADGSVVIGPGLPDESALISNPVIAILPDSGAPGILIESANVETTADLDELLPIRTRVHVRAGRDRQVVIHLLANGLMVDTDTLIMMNNDSVAATTLYYAPDDFGLVHLQVQAGWADLPGSVSVDLVTEITDQPRRVFIYDTRPAWSSTFIRRLLEEDRSFKVTARTLTSTTITADLGTPSGLDQTATLAGYQVIIIGAPEGLRENEVSALERWLRQTGGSLLLLLENGEAGPWRRLSGTSVWLHDSTRVRNIFLADIPYRIKATVLNWPSSLPFSATSVATDSLGLPLIWRLPVGAGMVWVSGATDSWRARDPEDSDFDLFWSSLIGNAANSAVPPISGSLKQSVLAPGHSTILVGTIRQVALNATAGSSAEAGITASLEPVDDSSGAIVPIRVVPGFDPGSFSGVVRPPQSGAWRVRLATQDQELVLPLLVSDGLTSPAGNNVSLQTWVLSQAGAVINAERISELPSLLSARLDPLSHQRRIHPMRSVWWIFPLVFFLGTEWWLRRRHGAP